MPPSRSGGTSLGPWLGLLLMVLACARAPQFTYQQVRDDLTHRTSALQELIRQEPELKERLRILKSSGPGPSPEQLQQQPVDDYESRVGIGYPYLLDIELYTPQERATLNSMQQELDRLGEAAQSYFQLEAEVKAWELGS